MTFLKNIALTCSLLLLAVAATASVSQDGGTVSVSLPAQPIDALNTVLCLTLK